MQTQTACPNIPGIYYPIFTVIVFKGAPSADHLVESYRVHFEDQRQAERFASRTVRSVRYDYQADRAYTPPCASVFEDSPSRGLGRHVAEKTSAARRRYLKRIAGAVS